MFILMFSAPIVLLQKPDKLIEMTITVVVKIMTQTPSI